MIYKIMCNPMQPLYDSLPVPHVPVRVTRGSLVADLRYSILVAEHRSTERLLFL